MAIIIGLEGTLARHEWRNDVIAAEGWDAYHQAADQDWPNVPMVQLVNAMHAQGQHVFCFTSRPEKWRTMTQTWLVRSGVNVGTLYMRGESDFRTVQELWESMLKTVVHLCGDVMLAIDTDEKACDFYRAAGIPLLQLTNPHGGT